MASDLNRTSGGKNQSFFYLHNQKWFRTIKPFTKKDELEYNEILPVMGPTGTSDLENSSFSGPKCLIDEARFQGIEMKDAQLHGFTVCKHFGLSKERKAKMLEFIAKRPDLKLKPPKDHIKNFTLFSGLDKFITVYDKFESYAKNFFEVVYGTNYQKPRFDIDIGFEDFSPYLTELELSEPETVLLLMDFECQKMLDILIRAILKLVPSLNIAKDLIVCSSHSHPSEPLAKQKRSLHVILNNFYHENHQEADMFFKDIVTVIPVELKPIVRWLDHSVYKPLQQFRILGSTKICQFGSPLRTKIFCEEFLFENQIISHIYSDITLHKHEMVKASGEGLDIGMSSSSEIPNFFADLEDPGPGPSFDSDFERRKFIIQLKESLLTETYNCRHLIWERPEENILSTASILKLKKSIYRGDSDVGQEEEDEFYFDTHELTKPQIRAAFSLLERMMNLKRKERAFPYEYHRKEKGMVLLKRVNPSLCRICKTVHDNEHPFIYFVKNHEDPKIDDLRDFYHEYFESKLTDEYRGKKEAEDYSPDDLVEDLIIRNADETTEDDPLAFSVMFDCRRSFSHLGYNKRLLLGYVSESGSLAILSSLLSPGISSIDRKIQKNNMPVSKKTLNVLLEGQDRPLIDYFSAPIICDFLSSPVLEPVLEIDLSSLKQVKSPDQIYDDLKKKELWMELILPSNTNEVDRQKKKAAKEQMNRERRLFSSSPQLRPIPNQDNSRNGKSLLLPSASGSGSGNGNGTRSLSAPNRSNTDKMLLTDFRRR